MRPVASAGFPDIDDALAGLPNALTAMAPYEQHVGYKSWKVPGRRINWLQWNDGGTRLRIHFDNSQGEARTWKLFARFSTQPGGPWDKPHVYVHVKAQWMPSGPDVWGCSYETLREHLNGVQELQQLLQEGLKRSYEYALQRYG